MRRRIREEHEFAQCLSQAAGGNPQAANRVWREYGPLMEIVAARSLRQVRAPDRAATDGKSPTARSFARGPTELVGRWIRQVLTGVGRAPPRSPTVGFRAAVMETEVIEPRE